MTWVVISLVIALTCRGHKKIGCSWNIDASCRLLPIRRLLSVGFDTAMRVIDV